MSTQINEAIRRQRGAALLVTVVTLLVATMIGLTALEHTMEEATAGGRARSSARVLQAADAGIQLAMSRLSQEPPNLNAFSVNLNGTTIQSRSRTQAGPQDLVEVGAGSSAAPEGYAINVGSGAGFASRVYQVNITASSGGSIVELETRFSRPEVTGSSY